MKKHIFLSKLPDAELLMLQLQHFKKKTKEGFECSSDLKAPLRGVFGPEALILNVPLRNSRRQQRKTT